MLKMMDDLIVAIRERCRAADSVLAMPDEIPFACGEGVGRAVVLRKDTAVELGGVSEVSCAFTLATSDTNLVRDATVNLRGRDIPDISAGSEIPFAQVILVAGRSLDADDLEVLGECQYAKGYIDGYLVRSTPGHVWSRVSVNLKAKGFDLASLGSAMRRMILARVPHAESVEVIYITSAKEEVLALDPIRVEWQNRAHDLRKELWIERGIDIDCPYGGGHCGRCDKKETCDEVRKMTTSRKHDEKVGA